MNNLNSNGVILDRLSELPDSLILEILSLLKMKDVVRTTLISKRWLSIWTTVPCLQFYERGKNFDQIHNFVSRALSLWRGTHLRKFSINASCNSESEASLSMNIALWVHFATVRKVEDLCIECLGASQLCLPQCLYECSSLRNLSLYCCNLEIRGDVKWDRLNTLNIFGCVVSEDAMNQVFSSSPQLETFTAYCHHPFQNWSIQSSSLKKFCINSLSHEPSVLIIGAPNLDSFRYYGTPYIKCSVTDSVSLTEMHLDFFSGSSCAATEEVLCEILPAIQHVETVQLSSSSFQMLQVIKGKYSLSPWLNVKLLTISETWLVELSDIVGIFQCFPKLEMLIIHLNSVGVDFEFDARDFTESEANILKSNTLQLRTVVVTWDVFEASFVDVLQFLLKRATMLKKMVIRKEGKGVLYSREKAWVTQIVTSLQRSFPGVELILC